MPRPARPPTTEESSPQRALDAALRFLATRPRSEDEVRRRLLRQGLAAPHIERALVDLRRAGLVDDAAFARYWVEQRQTFRPRGQRLLQLELRQHGIAQGLAVEAAEQATGSAEDDAYRAASKRARQLLAREPNLERRQFEARLGQVLARRGFDWETITAAIGRLWRELSPS